MSGRNWIPTPRLRGDKLRGNDVTLDGVTMDLWPTQFDENPPPRRPRGSGAPRQVDSRFRGNDQLGSSFQESEGRNPVEADATSCAVCA